MINANDIEKLVRDFCVTKKSEVKTTLKMDERIINDALQAHEKSKKIQPVSSRPNIGRIIIRSRLIKPVAAAVIIIAVLFGLQFIGGPDVANTAWAEVTSRFTQVDYVHMYIVKSRGE
ncbi:MAG: hypothetical protein ACYSWZ_17525 [Planctomycetota bacterium]|jgi:hypothetical protein